MPRAQSAIAFIVPELASETSRLDRVFFALADAMRRDILRRLRQELLQVSSIAEAYAVSVQAFSRHVRVLVRAGLVRQERSGRVSARKAWCGPEAEPWDYLDPTLPAQSGAANRCPFAADVVFDEQTDGKIKATVSRRAVWGS
jgi:DNA-binding transcriptional ArsR family regulator